MLFAVGARCGRLSWPPRFCRGKTVAALQNAFKDPSSPFYLAPGQVGPSDDTFPLFDTADAALKASAFEQAVDLTHSHRSRAEQYASSHGFDPLSFWEQNICWGDLDSFRHLNNVRYVRFIESGRMKYCEELAKAVDSERARAMLEGRGKSIILKSISVNFKRPVVYPDTLLVSHKPHSLESTRFHLSVSMYSHSQQAVVATGDAICVWYDYDTLKKCEAPHDLNTLLNERVKLCEAAKTSDL